ncbi:hypothetical protein V3C99_005731 [Haemonchus contortus]
MERRAKSVDSKKRLAVTAPAKPQRPAKRVAIVGAGPSGLPSARHAILYGCRPVVFEMTGEVGGLWNYKPQDSEEASVMKSTVINSSKEMSAYSDFPPKPDVANYMHNRKLLEYFQEYAEHYGLRKYIKFHHKVINVRKSVDYPVTGTWMVEYLDDNDGWHSEEFHGVLLCCGHHKVPHWPDKWPGQDEFKGRIVHSHDYKEPSAYENKRVVAVGIGNSGADVAVELSRVSEQVYLSTRRGAWILNRLHTGGMPLDTCMARRFTHKLMYSVPRAIRAWYVQRTINARFDHAAYGLRPEHDVLGAHTTQNDELPIRIASGTIVVKPNIERFTEHDVHFVDGTKATNIDHVILSTGYDITFPIMEDKDIIKVRHNVVDLYKYMYPLDQTHNTFAVIGLIQPVGSIMPIAEMQARVFFSVLSGESTLPSADEMRKDMLAKREAMKKQYVASYRHTIQVDYIPFMDELATIIGCRPRFWRLLLWDPPLAIAATFGPCAPYVYRIDGPHKWEGARDAILGLPDRVKSGALPGYRPPTPRRGVSWPLIIIGFLFMVLPRILPYLRYFS